MEPITIEGIPSDEIITMSKGLHRLFNAGGCNPMCHCCYHMIEVGQNFKLGTIREVHAHGNGTSNIGVGAFLEDVVNVIENPEKTVERITDVTHEVMLCEHCTPEKFEEQQLKEAKEGRDKYKKYRENGGGCFRVNGKIVH